MGGDFPLWAFPLCGLFAGFLSIVGFHPATVSCRINHARDVNLWLPRHAAVQVDIGRDSLSERHAHGEETRTFPPLTHTTGAGHVFHTYAGISPASPSYRHLVRRCHQPALHHFPIHLRVRRRLPATPSHRNREHPGGRLSTWLAPVIRSRCERLQRAFPNPVLVVV